VTMGKIASILQARGQLDEALRIRREEELPVYQKLGDIRSVAVTMGKIADILQARRQLDEALRIRREVELPVYQKLGDIRSVAVTMGKIADILQDRGQLDEALRIRREETLPVFQKLGVRRDVLVCEASIALTLLRRKRPGDREQAVMLLNKARAEAAQMRLPEAQQIESLLSQLNTAPSPPKKSAPAP
jgi:tetratricopeptide (TPR) repeat protein